MIIDMRKENIDKLIEKVEKAGYIVVSEEELEVVDDAVSIEEAKEVLENEGFIVLSEEELQKVEEKIEKEMIEKLEEKGFIVLSEEEIEAIDEKLKEFIEAKDGEEEMDSEDGEEEMDCEDGEKEEKKCKKKEDLEIVEKILEENIKEVTVNEEANELESFINKIIG